MNPNLHQPRNPRANQAGTFARSSWVILLALTSVCLSLPAAAHEVRPAFLQLTERGTSEAPAFDVLWKAPIIENGRLPIDPVFPSECTMDEAAPPEFTPGALIYRWHTKCDLTAGPIHIKGLSVTLTDVMVRFDRDDGSTENYLLRPTSPTLDLSTESAAALSYLVIGIEHLVFGIDHVLFVIGLVLFIRSPIMLLKTITAFTVAHSITLALSVLQWVRIEQGPVEAVIALSILFLARELVQEESLRSRLTRATPWLMAFIFGLLHGLGFAGALADIGLPEDALWLSLLLFNVGIEIGQIIIIACVLAIGWVAAKRISLQRTTQFAGYAMGCVAAYWTIDRTLLLM